LCERVDVLEWRLKMKKAIEVVFTIDEESGDLTADVKGAQGPTCLDEVLAGLDDLLGQPAQTVKKPEYHRRVQVQKDKLRTRGRR
jgi:hypothetical protein